MNNQWTTYPWKKACLDVMQSHPLHVPEYAAHIQVCIYMILQVHNPSSSLTQPISKTELLMKVVYRVITSALCLNSKKKFLIHRKQNSLIYAKYILAFKIFLYIIHVYILLTVWGHNNGLILWAIKYRRFMRIFHENWDTCSWLILQPSCKVILLTACVYHMYTIFTQFLAKQPV